MFIKCDVRAWAKKRFFELYPYQKLKRKRFDKEEGKTHSLFYENIRALGWL